jgi:protein-S-isoprenylcysteine O-methyltransferase Ste14
MMMSPDRSGSLPASSGVRVFPPAIYLGGLLIGFVVQFLWPVSLATNGGVSLVRIAGGGLLLIGVIFIAAAAMAFRHAGTSPNPTRPTTALTNVGPYRYSRNPMYVGLAVIQAGVALLANAVWPLVTLPFVLFIVKRFVIDREERYLEAKFGADYRSYKSAVRRWL